MPPAGTRLEKLAHAPWCRVMQVVCEGEVGDVRASRVADVAQKAREEREVGEVEFVVAVVHGIGLDVGLARGEE